MSLAVPIPLSELCRLAGVSRAGFYRWKATTPPADADMELRDEIQRIALQFSYYGSRRVVRELHERGWRVNRKKVQRLMREDNLLCLRKRRFLVTTDSNHALPVYPNLAQDRVLTGIDQLWRADITYGTPSQRDPPVLSYRFLRMFGMQCYIGAVGSLPFLCCERK
jgi:putative transposase